MVAATLLQIPIGRGFCTTPGAPPSETLKKILSGRPQCPHDAVRRVSSFSTEREAQMGCGASSASNQMGWAREFGA